MEKIGFTLLIEKYAVISLFTFIYYFVWCYWLTNKVLKIEQDKN